MSNALHYRPVEGRRVPPFLRPWALVQQELATLFRFRWGIALFLFCLLPGLARLVMLLIAFGVLNFGPVQMQRRLAGRTPPELLQFDPRHAAFYIEPVVSVLPGMVFFLVLTTVVVARSVAGDRAVNALELYWTRSITPWRYLLGKWLGGALLTSAITIGVPLVLWLTALFLAEDFALLADSVLPLLRALGALVVMTLVWTGIGTLLSTIAGGPNLAMVLWIGLTIGSSALGNILSRVLREPWLRECLSFWDAGAVLVRWSADLPQRQVSVAGAATTLVVLLAAALLLAARRLRTEEALQ